MLLTLGRTTNKPDTRIIAHPVGSTTMYGVLVVPVAGEWELQFNADSIVDTYVSALDIGGNEIFGHVVSPIDITPYIEPLFTVDSSPEAVTTWNPPANQLNVAGTNTGFSGNGNIVSDDAIILNTEVYLLKFDFTQLAGGQKSSSFGVTRTNSIGASDAIEFSCSLGQIIAGNADAFTPDVGNLLNGFIYLDMGNDTFSVYDSSDNSLHVELVGFNAFVPTPTMKLFFQLSGIKSPSINETTFTFDKSEFGDTSTGDLGVRLAANPNWKQAGES